MAKNPAPRPPAKHPAAQAVDSTLNHHPGVLQIPIQQTTQVFQGPVPPPDVLKQYDGLVPGTAQRMLQLAEDESMHRRRLEEQTNTANISAQAKQLDIADYQSRAVFRSDAIGQAAGLLMSLTCIGGSVYLALSGLELAAAALAAIPTAAVIQAFFARRNAGHPVRKAD